MNAHYPHIEAEAHKAAAEVVAKLVEAPHRERVFPGRPETAIGGDWQKVPGQARTLRTHW